jgi:hypothetical protein
MKAEMTTPTITLDMHQRTATDDDRTTSRFVLVSTGDAVPELMTRKQYEHGWEEYSDSFPIIADVVVEHPVIMLGSNREVLLDFRMAAFDEAIRLQLAVPPGYRQLTTARAGAESAPFTP